MTDNVANALQFIRELLAIALYGSVVGGFIVGLLRLHFSKEYRNFKVGQLVMRGDGTLDRKGMRDTVLFALTCGGFINCLLHHEALIIQYLMTMLVAWGVYHVADNKIPSFMPSRPGLHDGPKLTDPGGAAGPPSPLGSKGEDLAGPNG